MRNEAARFVTLIDALYEHKVKLLAAADAEPAGLYPSGDGSFEFQRTVSRLEEMRSAEYLARRATAPQLDGLDAGAFRVLAILATCVLRYSCAWSARLPPASRAIVPPRRSHCADQAARPVAGDDARRVQARRSRSRPSPAAARCPSWRTISLASSRPPAGRQPTSRSCPMKSLPGDKTAALIVRWPAASDQEADPDPRPHGRGRSKRADWTADPFKFVEKDGYFYGRGTGDIKNGIVATTWRAAEARRPKASSRTATSSSSSPATRKRRAMAPSLARPNGAS